MTVHIRSEGLEVTNIMIMVS